MRMQGAVQHRQQVSAVYRLKSSLGPWYWQVVQVIATKGAGTIGGSNTQIQFNDGGALAGNAAMVFNKATNVTTLTTLNLTDRKSVV